MQANLPLKICNLFALASMLVLTIGVTCLILGAGLTVFGFIQLAAVRRIGGPTQTEIIVGSGLGDEGLRDGDGVHPRIALTGSGDAGFG